MSGYKDKHTKDLNLGRRIQQFAVILPLAATMSISCGRQQPSLPVGNSTLLTQDSLLGEDLYGYPVTLKPVKIRIYDTAEVEQTDTYLLHWGTPKEELSDVYQGEESYVREVTLDDDEHVYMEVFKNQYGIEISKDQPCFMVTSNDRLAYIGDESSYFNNLKRYARVNKLLPANQEEKIIRDEYSHKITRVPIIAQPADSQNIQMPADSIAHKQDSLLSNGQTDSLRRLLSADTIVSGIAMKDSLLNNKETR